MVRYFSTKDLIQIGILCIGIFVLFLYNLKELIMYIRYRERFYKDYISCFQPEEAGIGSRIGGFVLSLLTLLLALIEGRNIMRFSEDEYYLEVVLCSVAFGLAIFSMVLELISAFFHMRTVCGISPYCISINSLFIPRDKVVYEEDEHEIIIYRKSKKKIKGAKLASQVYDLTEDRRLLNYLHIYYQKVDSFI